MVVTIRRKKKKKMLNDHNKNEPRTPRRVEGLCVSVCVCATLRAWLGVDVLQLNRERGEKCYA